MDLPRCKLEEEQGAGWLPQPPVYAAMAPTDLRKNRGGLEGALARLVTDALALVACLARVGLAGLLGAPAYGKRLHLSCADPPTVARVWKRTRGEGDNGAGCGLRG